MFERFTDHSEFQSPEAAAILTRIRAYGYDVRVRRLAECLEVRAADDRTGEHHRATARGAGRDAERACAAALAALVADELDG
ncbi:MAG TPA: hypothetical protein VF796_24635 [Humisphaera sp.]